MNSVTLREQFENESRVYTCTTEINTTYDVSDSEYIIWLENKIINLI